MSDPLEIPAFLRRTAPGPARQQNGASLSGLNAVATAGSEQFAERSARATLPAMSLAGVKLSTAPVPSGDPERCPACGRWTEKRRPLRIWYVPQLELTL